MKMGKKKTVQILYSICVVILLYFLIYLHTDVKTDVFQQRSQGNYQLLNQYENQVVEDSNTPIGLKMKYTLDLQNIPRDGACLMFYSSHQNVEVYLENELLYSVKPYKQNSFGKTPGCSWNQIPLYAEDEGKEITIYLIPAYENVLETVPDFYIGSQFEIWSCLIRQDLLPLLMSIVAMIVGMVFIVFIIYNYKNAGVDKGLLMLGCFSICIGLWKWSDTRVAGLFFPYSIAVTYIPYITLSLTIVPFLLYVKELFKDNENWIWYIPFVANFVTIPLSIVLQIRNVADMRETLWMNHLVMLSVAMVVLVMFIRELRVGGFNSRLRIMVICTGICLVGMVVDLLMYYFAKTASEMAIGLLGFLAFIIVLGVMSMRETKELIAIGLQARKFEQMAYHDQLTGLYNRTAYADYAKELDLTTGNCIMIMCDLNNLKKCNDTCGHEKGDEYIKNSAEIIQATFGDIGNCYRIGGDEFCVLVQGQTMSKCEERIAAMQRKVQHYNENHPGNFHMGIACGCVRYDTLLDNGLEDTLRRADKAMYYQKFWMKNNANTEIQNNP